jgi:YVTN family beta-propeller protein
MVVAGPSSPRAPRRRGGALAVLLIVTAILVLAAPAPGLFRVGGAAHDATAPPRPSSTTGVGPGPSTVEVRDPASTVGHSGPSPSILTAATVDLVGNGVLTGSASIRYANGVDGIAYDAAQDLVFVAGGQSDSIVAVDPSTGIVYTESGPLYTGNTTADPSPGSLAYDPTDHELFACDPTTGSVDIYNVSANAPSFSYYRSIFIGLNADPSAVLWVNVTNVVYVAEKGLDQVQGFAGGNGSYVGGSAVGGAPVALTYDPVQRLVFAADLATADTAWFSATTFIEGTSNFPVHPNPSQIAFDPDDDTVWVASPASISIVNAATRNTSVNLTFPASTHISGLMWSSGLDDMVVANGPNGVVSFAGPADTIVGNVTTGGTPATMVENTADSEVDLLDLSTDNLLRISELSQSLVGSMELGVSPGISSFNPVTERLEVPDTASDRIVEVSTASVSPGDRPIVRILTVPGHPVATTFDPVAGLVVVALVGGTVVGLNATSGAILRTTDLGSSYTLYDVLFADDQVFVTGGANLLWSLNPATLTTGPIIELTSLAAAPRMMAYSPAKQLLYVSLLIDNEVDIVNASSDVSTGTIAAGTSPLGVAFDPSNGYLFVADSGNNSINVIDTNSGASIDNIVVGVDPTSVLYVPGPQEVFESDTRSDTVTILNANGLGFVSTLTVGDEPGALAFVNVTGDVFAADVADSALSVVSAASPGGAPFTASLSVTPSETDVGTAVVFAASASYKPWDYDYRYVNLPAGCVTQNTSTLRCLTSAPVTNLTTSVRVTSTSGDFVNASATVTVLPAVSIASFTASRYVLTIDTSISFTAVTAGGIPPYAFSYPDLPPGCPTVTTGQFTCQPNRAGYYPVTVLVVDGAKLPATQTLNVTINPLIVAVPTVSPSTIELGHSFTILAGVSQGTPPYTISYRGLPPGCSSANTSTLVCAPTGIGNYTMTIDIVDASGSPAVRTISVLVVAAPAPTTSIPTIDYLLVIAAVVVIAIVLVLLLVRKRRAPPTRPSEGPGEAGPSQGAVYSSTSRTVPRSAVGPTAASGPTSAPPRYYVPPAEETLAAPSPSAASAPPGGPRPQLICPSCGAPNEPWITYCRRCKRPLQTT